MKYLTRSFLCLAVLLVLSGPILWGAQAQTICPGEPGCPECSNPNPPAYCQPAATTPYVPPNLPINTDLPINNPVPISGPQGEGPAGLIANFYSFAFLIAGFLAFIMIVYGGVRYAFSGGSSSAKEEAKDAIWQALIGLGLLLVAYLILRTINPDLTQLRMPELVPFTPTPAPSGTAIITSDQIACTTSCTCSQYLQNQKLQNPTANIPTSCTVGSELQSVLSCLAGLSPSIKPSITFSDNKPSTINGTHNPFSCHFGGRACIGIGHAADFSVNSGGGQSLTVIEGKVRQCGQKTGQPVQCYFEDADGNRYQYNNSSADHIHCNVAVTSCNCS